MPFGLTNAPVTFQRLMNHVLQGLNSRTYLIYLDDIVIFAETFDDLLLRLEEVLQQLQNAGLNLKPGKRRIEVSRFHLLVIMSNVFRIPKL